MNKTKKLKKYLLFIWEIYEAEGGFDSFVDSFNSPENALDAFHRDATHRKQGQIVNRITGQNVDIDYTDAFSTSKVKNIVKTLG